MFLLGGEFFWLVAFFLNHGLAKLVVSFVFPKPWGKLTNNCFKRLESTSKCCWVRNHGAVNR